MPKKTKNRGKKAVVSQKKPKRELTYWTKDEVQKLISTISELRDLTFFVVGLNTGLRISELTNILTSNINLDFNTMKIWDEKKDNWRNVTFPTQTATQIKMYLNTRQESTPKLFNFSRRHANNIIKHWCREAGVREGSAHWFRHTFIRHSRAVGRDMKVVQQNTGDKISTILKWYGDLSPEDRLREMDEKPLYGGNGDG